MSGNLYTQKMGQMYDTILQQCEALDTELKKLAPLAKQMHLLSSNAVSSAARAGSDGNAFRVLTQDIQLLGDDVSVCINDSQQLMETILTQATKLVTLFTCNEDDSTYDSLPTSKEARSHNRKLYQSIGLLNNVLDPVGILVKKGEYLAVFSSVEAANAGQHGESFEAVSSMLRVLVGQLAEQSKRQQSLLRDLAEAMEQQYNHEKLLSTA